MNFRIQKYPLVTPMMEILQHDSLPPGMRELVRCRDSERIQYQYVLISQEQGLSVLKLYDNIQRGEQYCAQSDFPMQVLSWFPRALEEFRKPPAEGGLHAGAMISADVDVDGEMLAVGSTTDGYYLINRSRTCHGNGDYYEPMEISFSHDLLYRQGFLNTWKTLGDRYEKGEL